MDNPQGIIVFEASGAGSTTLGREYARYGERIKQGGDLYEYHQNFVKYVSTYDDGGMETRSLASQEAWAKTLDCPVIRVDGTLDFQENVKIIAEQYYKVNC